MSQETYFEANTGDDAAKRAETEKREAVLRHKLSRLEEKAAAVRDERKTRLTVRVSGERLQSWKPSAFMVDAGPDCVCSYQHESNVLTLKGSKIDMALDSVQTFTIEVVEIG
jgi:hypothetical protein